MESGTAFCSTMILGYIGQGCWDKLSFYDTSLIVQLTPCGIILPGSLLKINKF